METFKYEIEASTFNLWFGYCITKCPYYKDFYIGSNGCKWCEFHKDARTNLFEVDCSYEEEAGK